MKAKILPEKREITLPIGTVLKESWKLLLRHPLLWFSLAIIVNFVSYIELKLIWDTLVQHINDEFGFNLEDWMIKNLDEFDLPEEIKDNKEAIFSSFLEFYSSLLNIILLQLIVARIVFRMLSQGGAKLAFRDILSSVRHDLFINLLRTIGISVLYLIYFVLICIVTIIFILTVMYVISWLENFTIIPELSIGITVSIFLLLILLIIMVQIYFASRWSLVEAVMVNENTSVISSFARSWELTSSCRFKIVLLMVVIILLALLLFAIFNLGIFLATDPSTHQDQPSVALVLRYLNEMLENLAGAIIISFCYHFLQKNRATLSKSA